MNEKKPIPALEWVYQQLKNYHRVVVGEPKDGQYPVQLQNQDSVVLTLWVSAPSPDLAHGYGTMFVNKLKYEHGDSE